MLNLNYWCEDEAEKERLKKVYKENEDKYKELLQMEFNSEEVFGTKEYQENFDCKLEEKRIVPKKKNIISSLVVKIKSLFIK